MSYTDLYFGHADAKTEAFREPESFVRSYVDRGHNVKNVIESGRFLVLGPKGAGKSALAWYLSETGRLQDISTQTRDISELPISEIGKLKTGEEPGISRSLNAWKFLLLCALLDVISNDQGSNVNKDPRAMQVIGKLRDLGFMDSSPGHAVLNASRTTIKINLPVLGEVYSRESSTSIHLVNLIPHLERWIIGEDDNPNRHYLFLDGLDSIYLNDEKYIPALSALVQSALHVNQHILQKSGSSNGGVILLIRNDIFSRLELPDGGKIRADWAVEMDWRNLSGNAASSPLFDLIDCKAVSTSPQTDRFDVVKRYFPETIRLGQSSSERDPYAYLLSLTRHTPRDLLQLLEHIRRVESDITPGARPVKLQQGTIREGVLQYSTKYFVDAIRNELVGRGGSGEEARSAVDALRNLGKRQFEKSEYRASLSEIATDSSPAVTDQTLRWLFFAGAIGNRIPGQSGSYLQFFHRRDDNDIFLGGELVIHNALVYAWAIPWN